MKEATRNYIKKQLGTNSGWALRALVKIYERQTADEQVMGHTKEDNGIGFSGIDSAILSSFAVQVNNGRNLSVKQMNIVYKRMPRYHKQVASLIPADKLTEIEKKAVVA
jgi:hypothetical protein